jgi:O-antigen biosynthesis protein
MLVRILKKKILSAARILKSTGLRGLFNQIRTLFETKKESRRYQKWIASNSLDESKRSEIRHQIKEFESQPKISIVMPVYNVDERWLRLCLDSVINQIYENWEFCIADDCSTKPHIRQILDEYQNADSRIKVVYREKNGHISAASNSALELATGEFTVLLDHDDELSEEALFYVAKELNDFPETSMIYSDEDMIDQAGRRFDPKFKPDWSPDLFLSLNMIVHLSAYKTEVLRSINGFEIGMEGSQDYDLALRVIEKISENQIRHIPRILYHWRAIPGSVALGAKEKIYAHERAREAIRRHLVRRNTNAKVSRGFDEFHRVKYPFADHFSYRLIAPEKADAKDFNSIAKDSKEDVLIFVSPGIESVNNESFNELASHAVRSEIGAVGGRICNTNSIVINNGVLIGIKELIGFSHRGLPREFGGKMARNQVIQNFSAVSGVLAIRRELFVSLGGFDEANVENQLFDVDLCLRLREKGFRIVFTPYAEFVQTNETETISPNSKEAKYFRERWKSVMENDPYFNPNLDKSREDYSVKL